MRVIHVLCWARRGAVPEPFYLAPTEHGFGKNVTNQFNFTTLVCAPNVKVAYASARKTFTPALWKVSACSTAPSSGVLLAICGDRSALRHGRSLPARCLSALKCVHSKHNQQAIVFVTIQWFNRDGVCLRVCLCVHVCTPSTPRSLPIHSPATSR